MVSVRTENNLQIIIKLTTFLKFNYAVRAFCTNKNYTAKEIKGIHYMALELYLNGQRLKLPE
jgi:hypothetical protein